MYVIPQEILDIYLETLFEKGFVLLGQNKITKKFMQLSQSFY